MDKARICVITTSEQRLEEELNWFSANVACSTECKAVDNKAKSKDHKLGVGRFGWNCFTDLSEDADVDVSDWTQTEQDIPVQFILCI